MERGSPGDHEFSISEDVASNETLVTGFAEYGLAGLTAVNYLVDRLDMSEAGHLSTNRLPAITPFDDGQPRHHTRLFTGDSDYVLLAGELYIPKRAADALADALLGWADGSDVEEITILSGVPDEYGPERDDAFYVATADYRDRHLADVDIDPMSAGFLEGLNAELMQRGLDTDLRVGVVTTPVDDQAPDVAAAVRLLDALRTLYDLDVDTGPLEAFDVQVEQYYADLAERMAAVRSDAGLHDRMYM